MTPLGEAEATVEGPSVASSTGSGITPAAVTPASAWKSAEPEPVTLPSGNVALLRRPSILRMIREGQIPNELRGVALDIAVQNTVDAGAFEAAAEFVAVMIASAFVQPRLVVNGEAGEGEITLEQLSDEDESYVIAWVKRDTETLARFRDDGTGAGRGADGRDVLDPAE